MTTSKAVAIFAAIYFIQWMLMGAMIHFVSDLTFAESLSQMAVGVFMIIFGWVVPVIVAIDYAEYAEKNRKSKEADREWARTMKSWK